MPRILVIEPEENVRRAVKQYLVKANHEVIEAESAETAIQKIKQDTPLTVDAAICDIRTPKIDGTEAIHYFKKKYPALPLIVITSFADAWEAEELLKKEEGIKAYLVKPIGKESLLTAVNKVVLE
jgi:DNA-binding NtrC family response regulator